MDRSVSTSSQRLRTLLRTQHPNTRPYLMEDAFTALGMRVKEVNVQIDGGTYVLNAMGWHSDGTPFAFRSQPFEGDPVARAKLAAEHLVGAHTGQPTTTTERTAAMDSAQTAPQAPASAPAPEQSVAQAQQAPAQQTAPQPETPNATPLPPAPTLTPAPATAKAAPAAAPGSFAASLKAMIDEAVAGVEQAKADGLSKVRTAVGKLGDAKAAAVRVTDNLAKNVEDQASSVFADLGQISNDLGGE